MKRIVYIHPGDMIEVRLCNPVWEATATGWKSSTRRQAKTVRFDLNGDLEVFDAISTNVFEGTGDHRTQLTRAAITRASGEGA